MTTRTIERLVRFRKYWEAAIFLESVLQYLCHSSILPPPPRPSRFFFRSFARLILISSRERLSSTLVVKIKPGHKLNKNALKSGKSSLLGD